MLQIPFPNCQTCGFSTGSRWSWNHQTKEIQVCHCGLHFIFPLRSYVWVRISNPAKINSDCDFMRLSRRTTRMSCPKFWVQQPWKKRHQEAEAGNIAISAFWSGLRITLSTLSLYDIIDEVKEGIIQLLHHIHRHYSRHPEYIFARCQNHQPVQRICEREHMEMIDKFRRPLFIMQSLT